MLAGDTYSASREPLIYLNQMNNPRSKLADPDNLRDEEDSKMSRVKQALKQRRVTKAVPALGAAGLTFSLVGGASAAVAPATDESQTPNYSSNHQITLGEEEIADISLATFYVFDKEGTEAAGTGVQLAWVARCGGCRACRACRGCAVVRACRCGCGGCGVGWGASCCASWGACRLC